MATVVVGTGSVHASAALCDHLQDQIEGDTVHAAAWAVGPGDEAERDAADALNGVRSRLGVRASVETHRLGAEEEGDAPVAALLTLADRTGADELVVGSGGDGGLDPDSVARLRADAGRPVVAVPLD
jgi:nucleotide-binding universal stress UspA family protein